MTLDQSQNLAGALKSGQVRFIEELRITDKSLPKDVIFDNPRDLAIDEHGNVYLSDYGANHIKVFDSEGTFLHTLTREEA